MRYRRAPRNVTLWADAAARAMVEVAALSSFGLRYDVHGLYAAVRGDVWRASWLLSQVCGAAGCDAADRGRRRVARRSAGAAQARTAGDYSCSGSLSPSLTHLTLTLSPVTHLLSKNATLKRAKKYMHGTWRCCHWYNVCIYRCVIVFWQLVCNNNMRSPFRFELELAFASAQRTPGARATRESFFGSRSPPASHFYIWQVKLKYMCFK